MAVKSLATLIKLQKTLVDEQRQHLATLQDRLDQIESGIAQLEIFKAREQAAAQDRESSATYGEFLKRMVMQGRILEKERQIAAHAVRLAQDKLALLFEEQKRYEIAETHRIKMADREELSRENKIFDEIGSVMHGRRKKD